MSLGALLGKGGESAVYEVAGSPDLVAKLYIDGRAEERREKIEAMVSAGLHRQASHISFPIDVLLDDKTQFVGFTMRRIRAALPIHQLWGGRDRQEKFPDATVAFMVRVAGNAARAVGELHQAGCVIGDINESGFLVTDQGTVVLIDSDSIQFTLGTRVFPCVVGTPQYLPPEHQGIHQRQLSARTPNHDNFGLAVMIFRLLMAGTHPFMGIWSGAGDPPAPPTWIEEFRYAYGSNASRMRIGPQPAAPPVDWLPDEITAAFEQAFGKPGVQERPTAVDWIGLLDRLEWSLVPCVRSRYHYHRSGTHSCQWCTTEKTRGNALFGPPPNPPPPPPPNFGQQPYTAPPPGSGAPPPRATPQPPPQARPFSNGLRNAVLGIIGVTIIAIWSFSGQDAQRTPPAPQQPQSVDSAQLHASQPPNISTEQTIRVIQEELDAKGCAPGPVDGIMGSATFSAIERFGRANNRAWDNPRTQLNVILTALQQRSANRCPAQPAPSSVSVGVWNGQGTCRTLFNRNKTIRLEVTSADGNTFRGRWRDSLGWMGTFTLQVSSNSYSMVATTTAGTNPAGEVSATHAMTDRGTGTVVQGGQVLQGQLGTCTYTFTRG